MAAAAQALFKTIIRYPRAQLHWHKSNVSAAEIVSPKLAVPGRFIPPAAPPPRPPRRLPPPPPATESARGKTRMEGARLPPPNIPPVSSITPSKSARGTHRKQSDADLTLIIARQYFNPFPISLILRKALRTNIPHKAWQKESRTRIYQHTCARPFGHLRDSSRVIYAWGFSKDSRFFLFFLLGR